MEEKQELFTILLTLEEKNYLSNLLHGYAEKLNQAMHSENSMRINKGLEEKLDKAKENQSLLPSTDMTDMFKVIETMYKQPKNIVLDIKEVPDNMTTDEVINTFREKGVLLVQSRGDTKPVNSYIAGQLKG